LPSLNASNSATFLVLDPASEEYTDCVKVTVGPYFEMIPELEVCGDWGNGSGLSISGISSCLRLCLFKQKIAREATTERKMTAPTVLPMITPFDDPEAGDAGVDVWGVIDGCGTTDDWGIIRAACSSVVREVTVK
jgi:hypothetical protein